MSSVPASLSPSPQKNAGQTFFSSGNVYNSDIIDMQTAQFIKTASLIQQGPIQAFFPQTASLHNSLTQSMGFRGSGKLPKDITVATYNGGANGIQADQIRLSINQDILQNSSVIGGNIGVDESIERIQVDRTTPKQTTNHSQRFSPDRNPSKRTEKDIIKDTIIHKICLFLAMTLLLMEIDGFYVSKMESSQDFRTISFTSDSQILFWGLLGVLLLITLGLFLLVSRGVFNCARILRKYQAAIAISFVVTHVCYFEAVLQSVKDFDFQDASKVLSIIWLRTLNLGIITYFFSFLLADKRFRQLAFACLIAFYGVRSTLYNLFENIIEILILVLSIIIFFKHYKLSKDQEAIKAKFAIAKKFRHILHKEPSFIQLNNKQLPQGGAAADNSQEPVKFQSFNNHPNINNNNNNPVNNVNISPRSVLNSNAFILSNAQQQPQQSAVSLLNKPNNLVSNNNSNQLLLASPKSTGRILKDLQNSNLQQSNLLLQGGNSSSSISYSNNLSANGIPLLEKQSLVDIPIQKKTTILEAMGRQNSNKEYQIIHQQNTLQQQQSFQSTIQPAVIPAQNLRVKKDADEQMTKISELDLETDLLRPINAKPTQERTSGSSDTNVHQNATSLQHNQNDKELKSLVEQVIEVDGVVVFDAETETVVFANQNILTLLETDQSHLLRDLHLLKQLPFLSEERSATGKEADFSTSNLLKHLFKDSGNAYLSSPVNGPQNVTIGKMSSSKMGSNPILNEVIEEEETEVEAKPTDQIPGSTEPILVPQKSTQPNNNSHGNINNKDQVGDMIISYNSSSHDRFSSESPTKQQGSARKSSLGSYLGQQQPFRQKIQSPLLSISVPNAKKSLTVQPKSRTPNAKNSPFLSPNPDPNAQNNEDEEEINSLRPGKKKTESIFKTLSPQFSASQNKIDSAPNSSVPSAGGAAAAAAQIGGGGSGSNSNSEIFNQTPNIELSNNRQKRDSLEQLFPSFISSISLINPRKSQMGNGSFNTIERERNNTLKDIIEDVRVRNVTVNGAGGGGPRKTMTLSRRKMLYQKRLLSYSQHPEVIMNNMVLYKENSSRMFLAKYSVIDHAGRVLHTITIRDMSNEVFEVILERQSTLLIEELYKHLNFTEISSVVSKSLNQLKDIKHRVDKSEYQNFVKPVRLNLRLFNYLMRDIFDVRSLQQRTFQLTKDFFDLQQELERIKRMTEGYRNDVICNFYYDKRIPIHVINDCERVSQILTNLLVNTCKLVKTKKIFLKAKYCEGDTTGAGASNQGSSVKIIIENRELKKPQKEQILKAFNNPLSDSLAYHFFITNLLAKQVSNHRYSLEVNSNSSSDYLKFKFHIHLFQNQNQAEGSYLYKPPSGISSNNAVKLSKDVVPSVRIYQNNSLSYLDYENINEEGGTNLPQTSKLEKGHRMSISKNVSGNNHSYLQQDEVQQVEKKTLPKQTKTTGMTRAGTHEIVTINNQNGTIVSGEPSEMSEGLDRNKVKDFDNIQQEFPIKFIKGKQTS